MAATVRASLREEMVQVSVGAEGWEVSSADVLRE